MKARVPIENQGWINVLPARAQFVFLGLSLWVDRNKKKLTDY